MAAGIAAAVVVLGYVSYYSLASRVGEAEDVQSEMASTTAMLALRLDTLESALQLSETKNIDLATALQEEQDRRNDVERQIKKISGTVNTLDKLSKTDEELLKKYSKVYFLNEHYVPSDLATIDDKYTLDPNKTYQIHEDVWPFLEDLLRAAARAKIELKIDSAYRSFGSQITLKSGYVFVYGAGTANQFSAEQGFSEHQLGTTVDFSTAGIGASLAGFEGTTAYKWLTDNAYKYGFTLSYPPGNAYYQFEPWHWRFVGVDLAGRLHREKEYFYDMDQRDIDKYLVKIFD
jgi:D-alanyl-D-alanine carboxypeptidase